MSFPYFLFKKKSIVPTITPISDKTCETLNPKNIRLSVLKPSTKNLTIPYKIA